MFVKLVIILLPLTITESAKILIVMPTPSLSHHLVYRPLIQELIDRQHEVTLITTDPVFQQEKPSNLKEIDVHHLSYLLWQKLFNTWDKKSKSDMLSIMTEMYQVASKVFEEQLKDKSIQYLLKDKTVKFDLLIMELCILPSIVFSHIFQAPVIQISPFGPYQRIMEIIGGVTHPFLYPSHLHERVYNLTILEKISELYKDLSWDWILKKQEICENKMLQHIFEFEVPLLNELKNNVDMLFLNLHPVWVHNQPVPPNVFYTWGIHMTPRKVLPEDLQSFLDSSTNGVIYISFGTNFKTSLIPPEKLEVLLEVFSQLPYNILWKWDSDELPGKSENIKISKWLPQCDVLRHPNLKLFITHGGLQSTDEAINMGVPLIGIPMFADQIYNTEKYEYFKIGIQLHFNSLSAEKLETAIKNILTDESYRENIVHLRNQMQDRPTPPLENAIWWIDYVLRHGGAKHLRAPAANMSWAEYYELELVLLVLTGLVVLVSIILYTLYSGIKRFLRVLNLLTIKFKAS